MSNETINSRRPESLDEIVSHSAAVLAEQIQAAAAWAKSEMDLQVEVAGALREFAKRAQINLAGHHNITIATGRPDSVYGSVIVEYKDPKTLSPKRDAAANKALVAQLKQRFYDKLREENVPWKSMFGVGTDGKYFIFLRFRDDKWADQEPLEVNRYSSERFLWALYNLGQKGKPYQPEYLHGDFGSESAVAQEGVRTLYEEILASDNPRAQVFFSQWKILFGEVCGYDVENLSEKLKKLAEFYVVEGKPQPAPLLFAVHSYYAILIKLLAAEIVSFFNPLMTRQVERLLNATTAIKLKRELEELERGGIFHKMGITNFLEGDLFSWYLAVWSEPIQVLVRKMITKLDEYNPGTFSEEPAQSRDLLKKLYQQLFPKSVRHDLGEYFTPDWLAEHVLNEMEYVGDPDKRLLDPACGSGTFLVMAINRIRRWYDQNREKCAYDEGELLKKILANVIGFDLNPLAVMAARTNYLVAIKDLVRHVDHVEIPVYLCDSIMTPAEYGDLFTGGHGKVAKVPCSAMKPPHLLVPKEIARSPKDVAKYADVLESCVKNGYAPDEFLCRCRDEGLNITASEAHLDLYKELVKLDEANENGIWARIIKNNFAPLFEERFDYVAGNPPWIRWNYLPGEYRAEISPLWQKYGLFAKSGFMARLATAELDFSMLYLYACMDMFVEARGLLGFVITLEVVKSKGAGEGFRRFRLGAQGTAFRVTRLDDMVALKPFHAANKTAAIICRKGEETRYPVPYFRWRRRLPGSDLAEECDIDFVKSIAGRESMVARPIDSPTSPWQTLPRGQVATMEKVKGICSYAGHSGVAVDPYGVYLVRLQDTELGRQCTVVSNATDLGDTKVQPQTCRIESSLLFPAVRGKDIGPWHSKVSLWVLVTNRSPRKEDQIPETTMRRKLPRAFSYLNVYKSHLLNRGKLWAFYGHDTELRKAPRDCDSLYYRRKRTSSERRDGATIQVIEVPFYAMRDIGSYSFSDHKVVWQMGSNRIKAAVLGFRNTEAGKKPILPCTGTVTYIGCESSEEAHYICACLNSSIANAFFQSFSSAGRGMGAPSILNRIQLSRFDSGDSLHISLSDLSSRCHAAASKDDLKLVASLEAEIDKAAATLWGITDNELKAVQEALAETDKSKRAGKEEDEND